MSEELKQEEAVPAKAQELEQAPEETQGDEPLTEVTSIAKEEEKTGEKIPIPSIDELIQRAAIGHMQNLRVFESILESGELSSKAKNRVILAVLALPTNKIPVKLKTDAEKAAFAYGQRAINDRFLVTQHYINLETQRRREEAAKKAAEAQEPAPPAPTVAAAPEASLPIDPNAASTQVLETNQGENNG